MRALLAVVIVLSLAASAVMFTVVVPRQLRALTSEGPGRLGAPKATTRSDTGSRTPRTVRSRQLAAAEPTNRRTTLRSLARLWAICGVVLCVLVVGVGGLNVRRRVRNRRRRVYELYEVHLSMHDEAKPQDLEDMVEAIAGIVRAWPAKRLRHGQPYFAIELHYGPTDTGLEWTLALRCQPDDVKSIDAAFVHAYPDVRIGHTHDEHPQPLRGTLPRPGHVLRFRKDRPFIYPISSAGDLESSPPIEAMAAAQEALGVPSSVRLQFLPAPRSLEAWARRRLRRQETKLTRQSARGFTEAGARGRLAQQEMADATRTSNRALFFLELQVAAPDRSAANRVAAAVVARRGENRLHRRWMLARENLYRDRFARALPPLLPTLSGRSIVSSAEVAHLLQLPTARMKGVAVRRVSMPRLPAPPQVLRADRNAAVRLPDTDHDVRVDSPSPCDVSLNGDGSRVDV